MSSHSYTSFGVLLRRYRGRLGLTQEQLAEQAGLSVTSISKLERGIRSTPRCETIHLLAAALDLSLEDRAALEHAACWPALPSGWPIGDQTVSLNAVLHAISSIAEPPSGAGGPPNTHTA